MNCPTPTAQVWLHEPTFTNGSSHWWGPRGVGKGSVIDLFLYMLSTHTAIHNKLLIQEFSTHAVEIKIRSLLSCLY